MDDIEQCLATDLVTGKPKSLGPRELRLKVFRWPASSQETNNFLGVVQYRFLGANPPMSCSSVARLFHVVQIDGRWESVATHTFNATHHAGVQRIRLADLTGDGQPELIVETDSGGGGLLEADVLVFDLTSGRFEQLLRVPAYQHSSLYVEDEFTQVLDIPATLTNRAQSFCFSKTVYTDSGVSQSPPKVSKPCYPRYTGAK